MLTKFNLKENPQCIYNMDEKGIQTDHAQPYTVELQWLDPDGSFTMDESNTFLSPQGFPPNTLYG